MHLDNVTVIFTSLLIGMVVSMFGWGLAFSATKARWRLDWALADTLLVLGVALLLAQGSWSPWLSIILANGLIIGGYFLLESGLRKFANKPAPSWYPWVFFASYLLAFVPLTIAVPSMLGRTVAGSLLTILTLCRMIWLLIRELPEERHHAAGLVRSVTVVFVLLVLAFAARMVLVFGEPPVTVMVQSDSVVLLFLMNMVALVAWTLGLSGLDNSRSQRLLQEALNTRDKMFSLVAHDLRGPVGNLAALLETIQESGTNPEESAKAVRLSAHSARQSYILLNNLLYWARSQRGELQYEPQLLDVSELLEKSLAPVRATADAKGLEIRVSSDAGVTVWADEPSMQTVIRNLTSNAVKFTPRNGLVTWKGWSDGDQLVLTITDTGPGLSPNLLKGIHRGVLPESTQGTEGEPGTGLGLGLCFDFTKANQGTLVFRSPGLGTEATLRLPLFKPAAPPR